MSKLNESERENNNLKEKEKKENISMSKKKTVKAESEVREEIDKERENRMGTAPVHGLLVRMALPLMVSMLVQSLYNIVDSIFVSRINEDALSAVSMSFPIQTLMTAVGIGTAVGMSALLSRFLGAKKFDRVNAVAQNGLFLAVMSYLVFLVLSLGANAFMKVQIGDQRIIGYGTTYLTIVMRLSIFVFIQFMFERFLQGTGKTLYILFVQGSGAIVNIIMDPILIFGLLGAPKLGVAGAAYATVMGQCVGMILGFILNKTKNKDVNFSMKGFRPDPQEIKAIYNIGIPSIIMQSIGSVMVFLMNMILSKFGSTSIATFGVYFKLQSFIFMPVFGFNNALIPIVAYNYGAKKRDRLEQAMHISARYGVGIMMVGTVIFWLFPKELLGLFDPSAQMLYIGTVMLRIISLNFPFAGYAIMRGGVFQALGKSIYSMYISIVRQLVVLVPVAFLLSMLGDVRAIWWAFPIAEIVGFTMSILFTRRIKRTIINKI